LTEVYKIDKEILYVTVFEGSKDDGTTLDSEAYDLWKALIPHFRRRFVDVCERGHGFRECVSGN
jgi:hypothetical protein